MRPSLPEYPWDLLEPYLERARAHPDGLIDLSVGSPIDPTPQVIQEALANATDARSYPSTRGSAALRTAIVDWYERRRGVPNLAEKNVLPTVGSKELIALLPFLLGLGHEDTVVYPKIAYPSYDMGAALAQVQALASDDPDEWPATTRLVWLNSPANPHGSVLSVVAFQRAVARARELGAVVASDECYAELGWEAPYEDGRTPSVLDPRVVGDDLTGVLSVYSLSKQSNLAGYRAAFIAGDERLIKQLTTVRQHAGLMVPGPVQAAMVAALTDDHHVAEQRERYRRRRDTLKGALTDAGFRVEHSEAGLYLWVAAPEGAWQMLDRLAEHGIVAGPGTFYGDESDNFVRFSLTATDDDISRAAARIASI